MEKGLTQEQADKIFQMSDTELRKNGIQFPCGNGCPWPWCLKDGKKCCHDSKEDPKFNFPEPRPISIKVDPMWRKILNRFGIDLRKDM